VDPDVELLQRLVGDVPRFTDEHWGRRSMRRASGSDFRDLIDLPSIERLLLSAARIPTFRLVKDGTALPVQRSTAEVRLGGRLVEGVADLARIAEAVDAGATLVLQGMQRTSPGIRDLCQRLERAVSHPVQANAYLTPSGSTGLARHHDDHDVLVLQVLGQKTWDVDDLGVTATRAGDVLYIPAGVGHRASTQAGLSLHLTIGLLRVTSAQLLRRALDRLPDADAGRPLSLGFARPEHAADLIADVKRALADALHALEEADPVEIAEVEVARARSRRAPAPDGALQSILLLEALTTASVVATRTGHRASLGAEPTSDGRLVLDLADRRLRLPSFTAAALQQLLDHPEVQVGHLRDLDPASQVVLVKRLVREGLLVVVRP
jgi:uncharacterized RmlC-like cupin family protein